MARQLTLQPAALAARRLAGCEPGGRLFAVAQQTREALVPLLRRRRDLRALGVGRTRGGDERERHHHAGEVPRARCHRGRGSGARCSPRQPASGPHRSRQVVALPPTAVLPTDNYHPAPVVHEAAHSLMLSYHPLSSPRSIRKARKTPDGRRGSSTRRWNRRGVARNRVSVKRRTASHPSFRRWPSTRPQIERSIADRAGADDLVNRPKETRCWSRG